MKSAIFMITFLIFLTVSPRGAQAKSLKEAAIAVMPKSKEIAVTGHPDYAPIVWATSDGQAIQGLAVELIEKAFSEMGVKVKYFNSGTWGRAQEEVKEGRIDMLLPPYSNAERVLVYEFFKEPILMDETVVLVKKGSSFKYTKYEDLYNHVGTAIISDSFGTEFDVLIKEKLKMERLATTEQCLEFLLNGRAQYMVGGKNSVLAVAAKKGLEDQLVILPKRVIVTGMYAPISKKSDWNKPEIHAFINDRIAAYAKSGVTKKLEKKYWDYFKTH